MSSTPKTVHFAGSNIIFFWKLLLANDAGTSLQMLTGECCWSQGARRKGRVIWLLNQAANLEPAGRLHPCKKSSDGELASCGEGEEPDTHSLISNMVLIWKQIWDESLREFCQRCQIKPSWGGSRNVQDCPDLQKVPFLGFSWDFLC